MIDRRHGYVKLLDKLRVIPTLYFPIKKGALSKEIANFSMTQEFEEKKASEPRILAQNAVFISEIKYFG